MSRCHGETVTGVRDGAPGADVMSGASGGRGEARESPAGAAPSGAFVRRVTWCVMEQRIEIRLMSDGSRTGPNARSSQIHHCPMQSIVVAASVVMVVVVVVAVVFVLFVVVGVVGVERISLSKTQRALCHLDTNTNGPDGKGTRLSNGVWLSQCRRNSRPCNARVGSRACDSQSVAIGRTRREEAPALPDRRQ